MGVTYKKIKDEDIKLVLLTHIHTDHFNKTTIKRLAFEHPNIKFVCLKHLEEELLKLVNKDFIYVLEPYKLYDLGLCKLSSFMLVHDVPNCGYRIEIEGKKCLYATDTSTLDINAKNYDLYLVEANYDELETINRINKKRQSGEYIYEFRAMNNHLSKNQCEAFLKRNMGKNSIFIPMHEHKEKE